MMRYSLLSGLLIILIGSVSTAQNLKDENFLVSMPKGFKVGSDQSIPTAHMTEMVPSNETVDDWSQMITQQIFFGKSNLTPNQFLIGFGRRLQAACPAMTYEPITNSTINGYNSGHFRISCPLNPQTNKPEDMTIVVIQGNDSFYNVQYAFRHAPTPQELAIAEGYLKSAIVCDTRGKEHPCPENLKHIGNVKVSP